MALINPKRIRLTEDVPDAFKGEFIPCDSEGEILLAEWVNGMLVWFVEFTLSTSVGDVNRYADVFSDQAIRLND